MTRRTWSAVLALSLAGGVYLAAQSAQASNMGFKLERDFDAKSTAAPGNRLLLNTYWVAVPLFDGLGDVANAVALNPAGQLYANVCVGDPTGPPAAGGGDGNIDAFDFVCDTWTDRNNPSGGAISMQYYDSATCSIGAISANRLPFNSPNFGGSRATNFPPAGTDLWTDIGYQISVLQTNRALGDPRNRAVIVGSHDPSFTGHTIHFSTTCGTAAARVDLVAIPYHTMYVSSDEVFCGLEGVAWVDVSPADGLPDTCTGGIFDDQVGAAHSITLSTFENGDPALGQGSGIRSQICRRVPPGGFSLNPITPFDLIPGEAYLVGIGSAHVDTILRSPHF
jgi:hypothetical protein